jgi:hypothetical protein
MARRGPIEDGSWPSTLAGFVGDPSDASRLHGYDVWRDLSVHYGFAELLLTALRGVAPDRVEGRAFELALTLLVPVSIAESEVHAAALAHMLGAPAPGVVATGAIGIAEHAGAVAERHATWLAWLDLRDGPQPSYVRGRDDRDRACAELVRARLTSEECRIVHELSLTVDATILALLHAAGLRGAPQMIAAWVVARLPATVAEAAAHPHGTQRDYPIGVPPFDYEEDRDG